MFVIGGEINSGISGIPELLESRNKEALLELAGRQIALGAEMLGINLGGRTREREELQWAVETIQEFHHVPVAFDTPDLDLFRFGLTIHCSQWGAPMLNSTTAEPEHLKASCELAAEHHLLLVALPTGGVGKEETLSDRLKKAESIVRQAEQAGVSFSDLFLDPMLYPLSVKENSALRFLETLRALRREFPETRTICGLDNISHGLPARELLSSFFLVPAMEAGLSAVIMKTNPMHLAAIRAGDALLGRDPSCISYIDTWRTEVWNAIVPEEGAERR
jgi:5-methyltetrahydrofolate corrinoid/iron sulfur protein methyltransferase